MTEENRKTLSLRSRFDNCEAKLGTVPITESITTLEGIFKEAEKLNDSLGGKFANEAALEASGVQVVEPPGDGAGFRELQALREDCNALLMKLHQESRN